MADPSEQILPRGLPARQRAMACFATTAPVSPGTSTSIVQPHSC